MTLFTVFLVFVALKIDNLNADENLKSINNEYGYILQYPIPRALHFTAGSSDTLVIGFGMDRDNTALDNMWAYDIDKDYWYLMKGANTPPARSSACSIQLEELGTLYMYGGDTQTSNCGNELWSYSYSQSKWTLAQPKSPTEMWAPGACHCALLPLSSTRFSLFGLSAILGRMYEYDGLTNTWEYWQAEPYQAPDVEPSILGSCCTNDPRNVNITYCFGGLEFTGQNMRSDIVQFNRSSRTQQRWMPSSTEKVWPEGRWGASCFVSMHTGDYYLVGGATSKGVLSNAWVFNVTLFTWTQITNYPSNTVFPSRTSIHHVPGTNQYYSWGGSTPTFPVSATLLKFDPTDSESFVKTLMPSYPVPTPRYGSNMFTIGDTVYLAFGLPAGTAPLWKFTADIMVTKKLTELPLPKTIPYRSFSTCIVDGHRVLFFFGVTPIGAVVDDILEWYPNMDTYEEKDTTWRFIQSLETKTPFTSPAARFMAAGLKYTDEIIAVHGGRTLTSLLDDTWIYHVKYNAWTMLKTATHPSGRTTADFVMTRNGAFLLHGSSNGGVSINDIWKLNLNVDNIEVSEWVQIHSNVTSQSGGVAVSSVTHSFIYCMFGDNVVNNMLFDTNTNQSSVWTIQNGRSMGNYGFTMVMDYVLLFGGKEPYEVTNSPVGGLAAVQIRGLCADGFILDPNSGDCVPCGTGFYAQQGKCMPCKPGTYNPLRGMATQASCLPCPEGTYQDQPNATQCRACPSMFSCDIGSLTPQLLTQSSQQNNRRRIQPAVATTYGLPSDRIDSILFLGVTLAGAVFVAVLISYAFNAFHRKKTADEEVVEGLKRVFHVSATSTQLLSFEGLMVALDSICQTTSHLPPEKDLLREFRNESEFSTHITFRQFLRILRSVLKMYPNYHIDVKRFVTAQDMVGSYDPATFDNYLVNSTGTKLSWRTFDIFGAASVPEVGEAKLNVRSNAGGIGAVFLLSGIVLLTYYYILDYVDNNVVETRSLAPRILLDDGELETMRAADFAVTLTLVGYPALGSCSCNTIRMKAEGFTLSAQSSPRLQCTLRSTPTTECVISYEMHQYQIQSSTNNDAYIAFDSSDEYFAAKRIAVEIKTSTGGTLASDTSRAFHSVAANVNNTRLRGRGVATTFNVASVLTLATTLGSSYMGYMLDITSAQAGQTATTYNYGSMYGHIVRVNFDASSSTVILISREQRVTWITFISNVLSCVSALLNVGSMCFLIYFATKKRRFMKKHAEDTVDRLPSSNIKYDGVENSHMFLPYLRNGLKFTESRAFLTGLKLSPSSAMTSSSSQTDEVGRDVDVEYNGVHRMGVTPVEMNGKLVVSSSI
eukprot:PhF_6_TR31126/c0_g1_i2/m.45564